MLPEATALPTVQWPYLAILVRLTLALALGLLIGLERERRGKEAGLRTFGFIAMTGAIGGSLGEPFALLAIALTGALAIPLNVHTIRSGEGTELTTSAAMLVTSMSGVLCGQGHTITPAAVMVGATALLAWKERLADLTTGLTEGELRSALMLAILAIVIYPALPVGAVGPWDLVEPRAAWVTVILIASIGFVNYALWRMYGERGTMLSGFFGGLVNSNFTVVEMANRVRESGGSFADQAYRGILVALAAMVVRNATLLLVLAPLAFSHGLGAFALMLAAAALLGLRGRLHRLPAQSEVTDIRLELPFSLRVALRYGALFLALHIAGRLMQIAFGDAGFYLVTLVGGLLSSASAVAAAASMASQEAISAETAANGAVLASITSLAFSLSFVVRSGQRRLARSVARDTAVIAVAGLAGLALVHELQPWIARLVPG